MNYLLYGEEQFLLDQKVKSIIKDTGDAAIEESISFYDASSNLFSLQQALDDADTLPLFSSSKIVVIENALFLTASATLDERQLAMLESYLKNPHPATIMIFIVYADNLDRRKKAVKIVEKFCQVETYASLTEQKLLEIVSADLASNKITLNSEAFTELKKRVPANIMLWKSELAKLKLYNKEITSDVIKKLITRPLEDDVFALVNMVIKKDLRESLLIWEDLSVHNKEPLSLVLLLASQFRVMYQCKVLADKGLSQQDITSILKIHPFRVKKALEAIYSVSEQRLLELLNMLGKLDQRFKTGEVNKQVEFELFLLEATR